MSDSTQALLQDGSPAKADELRCRFNMFLNDRCNGKDSTKLCFVIEQCCLLICSKFSNAMGIS